MTTEQYLDGFQVELLSAIGSDGMLTIMTILVFLLSIKVAFYIMVYLVAFVKTVTKMIMKR